MQTVARNSQSNKTDFIHGIRPVYFISRTVGLWPFSIVSSSSSSRIIHKAQIRAFDIIWLIISIGIFIAAIFIYIEQSYVDFQDDRVSTVYVFGFYIFEMIGLIFGIFAIVIDLFNRNNLIEILQQFSDFDNQVG